MKKIDDLLMFCKALLLVGPVLVIFPHLANAQSAQLASGRFQETLRPAANTGGARVMGLQFNGLDAGAELKAYMPASGAGDEFCVRTGSSDGLYGSENTYVWPDDTREPIEVPHYGHTEHGSRLSSLHRQGFGIRIFQASCDNVVETTANSLAIWRNGNPATQFTIFVNSFAADRLVAIATQEGAELPPVDCQNIQADITVAFDRSCEITFVQGVGTVQVELLPIKGGKLRKSEFITVQLP